MPDPAPPAGAETPTRAPEPPDLPTDTFDPRPVGPFADAVPHARGGLGEVFRATDPDLHRAVAVKRLRRGRADDPGSRRRFLVEAEVTARLEHPGVVPVYALYPDAAGGPAYAMRFVAGPTLGDELTAYHAGPPDPVRFRRLVQAFLTVCQTVAYAHARGVIHRDLKPQNVLLGKFGETLVVDWGLAKVVGRPDELRDRPGTEETLVPSSGSGDGETALGSAVGTPAYMSPEQAAGRWDVVDARSDVYGLGAVLYTVLTGRPPLAAGNWPQMQQRIQRGDFPRPRQVKPGVPRALEAVCLKAMALDPTGRYPSADALAADVEHWLADQPVAACRDPLPTRVRRWAQRHRTVVSGAAVLVAAAVVALATGTALLNRERVKTDGQRRAAEAAEGKARAINRFLVDDLLRQADPVNNPAGAQLTVRGLFDQAAARLDAQTELADQPDVEAELRAVIGHAYEYLDAYDRAEPHYRRAWDLRAGLDGPDHPRTLAARNRFVCAVVNRGRLAEADGLATTALDACTRALGPDDPETAEAANNLAEVRMLQHDKRASLTLRRQAARVAHAANGPDDPKALEYDSNLAVTLVTSGSAAEAVPLLEAVVAHWRRVNPKHPELGTALTNLGGALIGADKFPEAQAVLDEAVELQKWAKGKDSPSVLAARNLFWYACEGQGHWAAAEAEYGRLLHERRAAGGRTGLGVQRTLAYLARACAKQEHWADTAHHLAALLVAAHPDPKRDEAALAGQLAAALDGSALPAAAGPVLAECVEVLGRDTVLWPGDWLAAEVSSRYGDCLRRQGKFEAARPVLEQAAADVARAPGAPEWGRQKARERVAKLYTDWKNPVEAARWR